MSLRCLVGSTNLGCTPVVWLGPRVSSINGLIYLLRRNLVSFSRTGSSTVLSVGVRFGSPFVAFKCQIVSDGARCVGEDVPVLARRSTLASSETEVGVILLKRRVHFHLGVFRLLLIKSRLL